MTDIILNCLIIPKGDLIGISIIKVMQAITINSSSHVSALETAIQDSLGPPFNNIPLRICQIYPGSVVEGPMDLQTPISLFFPEKAKADTEHDSYLIENWDTETLINFLKEQNLKLEEKHYDILCKEEITGQNFLDITEEKFRSYGLKGGPAMRLAKEVQTLKEKPKRAFFSYLSLSEVLAKYGLNSDGIDSIPLFSPPTYEIQNDNKVFKRCMEEILGRLRSYGILQPDSLEAMRNKYVIALLHASIHIVMDITNKDLSMKPQYGIVGEES
ncbi:hypothetical protein RclHR1_12800009 [Rhizophagus clarus]|uniref:SAM domain-containing protein n=1 Tax=Rhizophagus clarus TaxID=94130 RepID=A0A2Z6Q8B0_9GLOM|nr:hypothetical protein RclHR1_12800009 [Rhizophagus clarus]